MIKIVLGSWGIDWVRARRGELRYRKMEWFRFKSPKTLRVILKRADVDDGARAPLDYLSRAMSHSICGFRRSFWQLYGGWKRNKERHLRLEAERSEQRLLQLSSGEQIKAWTRAVTAEIEREEFEEVGSPGLVGNMRRRVRQLLHLRLPTVTSWQCHLGKKQLGGRLKRWWVHISHTKSLRTQKETEVQNTKCCFFFFSDFGVEKTVGLFKAPCKNIHLHKDALAP